MLFTEAKGVDRGRLGTSKSGFAPELPGAELPPREAKADIDCWAWGWKVENDVVAENGEAEFGADAPPD